MALKRRYTIERIHELTRIDRWFLSKLLNIIRLEVRPYPFLQLPLPTHVCVRVRVCV